MKNNSFFKIVTAVSISLSASVVMAQNVDRESIEFDYIKYPSKPLGKDLKGYTTKVIQSDPAKNKEIKAAFDAALKAADDKYNKEVQEVKDKEKAKNDAANKTKLTAVLNAMQPKDQTATVVPVKETVPAPFYYKEFNGDVLSSQYIKLNGFKKGANDIEIVATLSGFEFSEPTYSVNQTNQHSYTFTYKNPVHLAVSVAGSPVTDMLVANSGNDLRYTSGTLASKGEAEYHWKTNRNSILDKVQNESTNLHMRGIDYALNDMHGITKTKRSADLYTVKNKKGDYNDVVAAYTELNEGLLSLGEDLLIEEGKTKIKAACEKFELILKDSNPTDKKAHVNQDVTTAVLFNLIEANIWLNEYVKGQKFMLKLRSNNINNREERRLDELKEFMTDHKQRFDANK